MAKMQVNFNLPVMVLKEGDVFVAYSPAIDISTVGETFEKAQSQFEEAVQIFFEEITENNTLEEALFELGWQKKDNVITPPVMISNQTLPFSFESTYPVSYA
jgi:predicted RNase H-like HicB family nuclease